MADAQDMLDAAAAAREVALFTALLLIQTGGDGEAAIRVADEFSGIAPPESMYELDCTTIAGQAIRDALALQGTTDA